MRDYKSKVVEIKLKAAKQFFENIKALASNSVLVGFPMASSEDKREGSKEITNAELAYIHEFGTAKIPARPFLRPGIEEGTAMIVPALTPDPMHPESTAHLELAGMQAVNAVRTYLNDTGQGNMAPLSPVTIRSKQRRHKIDPSSSEANLWTKLVDTGQMRNAVTYVVEKGKK